MSAPERYAVFGHPIAHSRSPQIHQLFAQQTGARLHYEALDVPPQQLAQQVRAFFAAGGAGLNITVPHKQAVLALCNQLSARARTAAAANTLWRDAHGELVGDNTDGVGLVRDLTHNLQLSLQSRRILLLGAGGAARGVLAPLLALEPSQLLIANRTSLHATLLAKAACAPQIVSACGFEQLPAQVFDLIINATSTSLQAQAPSLPPSVLAAHSVCYDMAYGEQPTPFMRWASAHGARQVHMGLGMLVEQAAEAFFLWRGVRPDSAPVLKLLRTHSLGTA